MKHLKTSDIVEDFENWYVKTYGKPSMGFIDMPLREMSIRVALYVLDKSESD